MPEGPNTDFFRQRDAEDAAAGPARMAEFLYTIAWVIAGAAAGGFAAYATEAPGNNGLGLVLLGVVSGLGCSLLRFK